MLRKGLKGNKERQGNGKCESSHDAPPWRAAWLAGVNLAALSPLILPSTHIL